MLLLGRPYTDENGHIDDELFTDLTEEDQAKVMTWIKENISQSRESTITILATD